MGGIWFVSKRELNLQSNGEIDIILTCVDQQDILRRYIMWFDTGTAQATQAASAESVIKSVVANNLLTADSTKHRTGLSRYITMEPISGSGRGYNPSAISSAWQNVQSICAQVARSSTQYLNYIAFDLEVESVAPISLLFRVYSGQRGTNRSGSSAHPVTISDDSGNFSACAYVEDFSSSASCVVCGGQSTGGVTATASAVDTTLDAVSPFAHTEMYVSQQMTNDTDTLLTQANDALRLNRPILDIENVTIIQSPGMQYGIHFDFGDMITAKVGRIVLLVRIESLTLSYDASSQTETVNGTLRSEYSP
jgi:hypothetical protein